MVVSLYAPQLMMGEQNFPRNFWYFLNTTIWYFETSWNFEYIVHIPSGYKKTEFECHINMIIMLYIDVTNPYDKDEKMINNSFYNI